MTRMMQVSILLSRNHSRRGTRRGWGGGDPHAIISAIFPPHPEEPGSQGDFREVQLSGPEITAITVARIAIFNPDGTKNPAESARLMAILQEARDLTQQPTDTPIVCSR